MTSWTKITNVSAFEDTDRKTFKQFTVFYQDGDFFACENRCPHMGYPMNKGTIRDGVITCAWHYWDFDLKHGGCYRGACDDLKIYPCKVENEDIYVNTSESNKDIETLLTHLRESMRSGDIYLQSKAINQLVSADVPAEKIVITALQQAYLHSQRNHQTEQSIYETQAIINAYELSTHYPAKEKASILIHGIKAASGTTGDRMEVTPLPEHTLNAATNNKNLIRYSEESSSMGIERILLSIYAESGFSEELQTTLLALATQTHYANHREVLTCISAIIQQSKIIKDHQLDRALLAQAAWVLGKSRTQPNLETKDAIKWLDENDSKIMETIFTESSESNTTEIEKILFQNNLGTIFKDFLHYLEKGQAFTTVLNDLSQISAKRFSRLWLNNGGMWNSASEGFRLCNSIRETSHLKGTHQMKALFFLVFYFYQTRWVQPGIENKNKSDDKVFSWDDYNNSFESLDEPTAKNAIKNLTTKESLADATFIEKFTKPLLNEDLSLVQLNTLIAVLHEAQHNKDWQPYLLGMITYSIDQKLSQNTKSASKFGLGYF
ncbi:MAG: hypothetical protein COA79_03050 [Planctomycetota bacterium]|nr:MAG: hypothetical protein COA79_03050 [Planctomycetota bacterium]